MKKTYYLVALLLVFAGCEKDEITPNYNQQDNLQSVQKQFSMSDFEDGYIKENLEVNWNSFRKIDQKGTAFEFTTSLKSQLQNDQAPLYYKYHLVAHKNNENWRFELVKFLTFDAALLASASIDNTEDFTGTLYKYDMTGATKQIRAFEKGESFSPIKKENPDLPVNTKYEPPIWQEPGAGWITITTTYYRDYWEVGQNDSGEPYAKYLGSYKYDERTEHVYVPSNQPPPGLGNNAGDDNYHQHVNAPHGPSGGNPHNYEKEVEEKPVKIINELKGKAKCVYNKLNQNGTSFADAIKKFDGEFPVSHLKLRINNNLPSWNYGTTNPPSDFRITIEMSNTQLKKISDLGGAVAFIHEVIHAEIYRKMLSAAQTGDLDPQNMTRQQQIDYVNSLRENFEGIYDYYIERYQPTWNHDMMAEHYINVIADAIQDFDNSRLGRQIYEDLAWVGLRKLEDNTNSIAWNNLKTKDQQRILNNLQQYFFNGVSNCN